MESNRQILGISAFRVRQAAFQRGSTLIWVMVVVLVMIVALGVGLTAVSGQLNLSSVRHEEHQAYYTALSSTETVAAWITENADGSDQGEDVVINQLFEKITGAGTDGITIDEAGIPPEAGTCTVNLRWLDGWPAGAGENHTQLKITSVATFAGVTETVSLTLTRPGFSPSAFEGELKASNFSTTTYDNRAIELNTRASDGIVALYESNSDDNSGFNLDNAARLNDYISSTSELEARWTNVNLLSSSRGSDYHNNVLGTERHGSSEATDSRRFMVPQNGRIIIDPLEDDDHEGSSDSAHTSANSVNNTRFVGLAIDGTAGKNVLFRLASGSAATGTSSGNVFIKTDIYSSKIRNTITTTATLNNRSSSRYASIVTLDFTDNAGSNATASYTIDGGSEIEYPWHPDKWESMDLFVQSSGQMNANLVFGPFGHKDGITMDYDGKGNFADNYNGVTGNNLASEWPDVSKSRAGLPVFSVDFGENAHFWILDSPTYKLDSKDAVCYAWFMQGTNILGSDETGIPGTDAERSSIYSTRAVVLGGALIRTNDGHTTDNLNRELDGFADMGVGSNVNYVEATTRFSQLIYNTDIILKAPSSGTAASEIRRPQTWRDRTYHTSYITDKDKTFAPTMTIKGGTIYVGNRQELTIQGTVTGVRSGTDPTVVPLDNMWISPDRIIVATGGALIIRESKTTNVITDIYVDGGTLTIKAGAKIKGNIYAYNGGTVKLEGAFQLDFPDEFGRAHDGLLIYGNDTVGAKIRTGAGENDFVEITEAGQLETPAVLAAITGTSSRVHLVGGDWATLVPKTPVDALKGAYAENFLCEGYNKQTGRCPHYDGRPAGSEGWVVGIYDDS